VGVSVLVATHDVQLISRLKHRVLALGDGRLLGERPSQVETTHV